MAIGTMAGLTAHYSNLGVIWFDAHADLNTEEHSLTGNMHGMSVAAFLGHSAFNLSQIKGAGSFINPSKLVYIGLRDLDDYEKEQIRALGIRAFTMHDIDRLGMQQVIDQAMVIAGEGRTVFMLVLIWIALIRVKLQGWNTRTGWFELSRSSFRDGVFSCE